MKLTTSLTNKKRLGAPGALGLHHTSPLFIRRVVMKQLLFTLLTLVAAILLIQGEAHLYAATPSSGTLVQPSTSGATSSVTWPGGPYTAVTADPPLCTSPSCDNFLLTVNVS